MPIVSSQIIEDSTQLGGRRSVRERHVDHVGSVHFVHYLAELGANVNTALSARVSQLEAQLRQNEIDANLAKALNGETNTFTFIHSTVNQNLAALRELYKTATRWEVVTLGHVLHHQNLTNTQIQNLFGVGSGAPTQAVKDKLAALDTRYHDVIAQIGQ